eukprot:3171106-Amphidinium_carterae.1
MLGLIRGSDAGRGVLDFVTVDAPLPVWGPEEMVDELGCARRILFHGVRLHTELEHRDRLSSIDPANEVAFNLRRTMISQYESENSGCECCSGSIGQPGTRDLRR